MVYQGNPCEVRLRWMLVEEAIYNHWKTVRYIWWTVNLPRVIQTSLSCVLYFCTHKGLFAHSICVWVCVNVWVKVCIESMVDAESGSEAILCVCVSITIDSIQNVMQTLMQMQTFFFFFLLKFFCRTQVLFVEPLIPLLWWHLSWVSKPGWIPSLACFLACTQQIPQIHLWCDTCLFHQ